jgi:hypothetical protein
MATAASIALVVKRAVVAAARADGITKAKAEIMAENFAGHSLRAGHAIQRKTGSPECTARRRGPK